MNAPKTKLITALREAARQLRDGSFDYRWTNPSRCNCGLLASCAIGRQVDPSDYHATGFDGLWGNSAPRVFDHCELTWKPLPLVFQKLKEIGIDKFAYRDVERCENPLVLARMGLSYVPSDSNSPTGRANGSRCFVADYFTAWADILEEETITNTERLHHGTTTADQLPAIEVREVRAPISTLNPQLSTPQPA